MSNFGLSVEQIENLFPFMVAVDRQMRVLHVGRSLKRLAPALATGVLISDHLTLIRPKLSWFDDSLARMTESNLTVHIRGMEAPPLKGQLMSTGNGEVLQLMLRPAIANSDAMSKNRLSVQDFALHDPLVDYLFLLQAQETNMRELRSLTRTLDAEQQELEGANLELGLLYSVSDILGHATNIKDASAAVLSELCKITQGSQGVCWARGATSEDSWLNITQEANATGNLWPANYRSSSDSVLAKAVASGQLTIFSALHAGDALEDAAITAGLRFSSCIPFSSERTQFAFQIFSKIDDGRFNRNRSFEIVQNRMRSFLATHDQREDEKAQTRRKVQRLTHAAQSAVEKNQQKTEYLSHVSHDIRTPMNAILGMSELLLRTELDPTQADYATIVRDSTQALLGVINSSLDLTRIESGRFQLKTEPFDLHSLIESCCYLFAQQAHAKGLAMTWTVAPDVPRGVRGDGDRLRQVIANLLGNAIKFTDTGSVSLDIHCTEVPGEEGACRLEIAVSDTGRGIAQHELREVLEPFTQAQSGRREGSGLGLAIVDAFVKLMDGDVELASDLGKGTRICVRPKLQVASGAHVWRPPQALRGLPITLLGTRGSMAHQQLEHLGCELTVTASTPPKLGEGASIVIDLSEDMLARADLAHLLVADHTVLTLGPEALEGVPHVVGWPPRQRALAEQLSDEHFESLPTNRIQPLGGRVLVVDDSPLNRRLVGEFLKIWGLEFDEAQDGASAVTLWEQNDYRLIIMDCQMPILDGLKATSEIRRREAPGQHIPIIALTAHAMATDEEHCRAAGMDEYLSKPIVPEALHEMIVGLLFAKEIAGDPSPSATTKFESKAETIDEITWTRLVDLQRRSGDGLLAELLEIYRSQGQELSAELRNAIIEKDTNAVRRVVHRLKGSAGNIGAARVVQLCREIEDTEEPTLADSEEVDMAVMEFHGALAARISTSSA